MRVVRVTCPHLTEITFLYEDGSTGPHACPCNEPSKVTHVYGVLVTTDGPELPRPTRSTRSRAFRRLRAEDV